MGIKYCVVSTDGTNTVSLCGVYLGNDFTTFANTYMAAHPNTLMFNNTEGVFPYFCGWRQVRAPVTGDVTWVPPSGTPWTIAQIQPHLLKFIFNRTNQLLTQGTFSYAGSTFPCDDDTRDQIALLAFITSASTAAANAVLPFKVVSLEGNIVTLNSASDVVNMSTPLLQRSQTLMSQQAAEVTRMLAINNIHDLMLYYDTM